MIAPMFALPRCIAVVLSLCMSSGCATLLHPERKGNASRVDVGPLVFDILWLAAGILPGVLALTVDFRNGAIYQSETRRTPKRKRDRSSRFDATRLAQAEFLNDAFDDLPNELTDESRMRLLYIAAAYRQHRKKYGDHEDVDESLRRLENGLYFWNMNSGYPIGYDGSYEHIGGKGEPVVVVEGYAQDPDVRYRYRKQGTTSVMLFSSITTIEEGLGGLTIPQMTGAPLTRRIPTELHMEPRAAILAAMDEYGMREQPSSSNGSIAGAMLECGIEMLGAEACQDMLADVTTNAGASLTCSAAQQLLRDGEIDAAQIASEVVLEKAGSLGQGILFLLCVADRS